MVENISYVSKMKMEEQVLPRAYEAPVFTSSLDEENASNMTACKSACRLKSLKSGKHAELFSLPMFPNDKISIQHCLIPIAPLLITSARVLNPSAHELIPSARVLIPRARILTSSLARV